MSKIVETRKFVVKNYLEVMQEIFAYQSKNKSKADNSEILLK